MDKTAGSTKMARMMARRSILLQALSLLAAGKAALAADPALSSQASFFAALKNQSFECSFTGLPRARFFPDRVESLNVDNSIAKTYQRVSCPEPGLIRVDFNGMFWLMAFSDDLQSFVIGSMNSVYECDFPATDTITFKDHPDWKQARLSDKGMELLDAQGSAFATNPGISFFAQVQGFLLPEKGKGMLVKSRQRQGGWYASGRHLGTGVLTQKSGYFRNVLNTSIKGFPQRSAHFGYWLLRAGLEETAAGQERYAASLVEDTYGPTSAEAGNAWKDMGTLRGWARSYKGAPALHARAVTHAKEHFPSDKAKLLDTSVALAGSQADAGDFAGAKGTLAGVHDLLPADGANFRVSYDFHRTLAEAEFGLKNYPSAMKQFADNIDRAKTAGVKYYEMTGLLGIFSCQLAQNDLPGAQATLKQCIEVDERETKEAGGADFDRWELAFACVALGQYEEALKYAPTGQRRNWVGYEEYARLVCLFLSGDRDGSKQLGKEFIGRFSSLEEINIRHDLDVITIKLTQALAAQTAAATTELEQTWAEQVQTLRDRPLKNYLFAKVMVAVLSKLKSGK